MAGCGGRAVCDSGQEGTGPGPAAREWGRSPTTEHAAAVGPRRATGDSDGGRGGAEAGAAAGTVGSTAADSASGPRPQHPAPGQDVGRTHLIAGRCVATRASRPTRLPPPTPRRTRASAGCTQSRSTDSRMRWPPGISTGRAETRKRRRARAAVQARWTPSRTLRESQWLLMSPIVIAAARRHPSPSPSLSTYRRSDVLPSVHLCS